ncbi:MAG: hypothetical protein HUK00_05670 [Bacteroidaceae bacterium]|nr:hypothetical protein [Bacteroidaceae bacterium]
MKYLALLDNSISKVRIIKLDNADVDLLESKEDAVDFIYEVQDKYDFKENQCSWMLMNDLNLEIS